MNKKLQIHRRTFLRGTGATALSLPLLQCMASNVESETPKRFLALYVGHGFALHGDWRWIEQQSFCKFVQSVPV